MRTAWGLVLMLLLAAGCQTPQQQVVAQRQASEAAILKAEAAAVDAQVAARLASELANQSAQEAGQLLPDSPHANTASAAAGAADKTVTATDAVASRVGDIRKPVEALGQQATNLANENAKLRDRPSTVWLYLIGGLGVAALGGAIYLGLTGQSLLAKIVLGAGGGIALFALWAAYKEFIVWGLIFAAIGAAAFILVSYLASSTSKLHLTIDSLGRYIANLIKSIQAGRETLPEGTPARAAFDTAVHGEQAAEVEALVKAVKADVPIEKVVPNL